MKKKIQKLETKNEDNLLNSGNKFKKIQKLETKMKIIDQIEEISPKNAQSPKIVETSSTAANANSTKFMTKTTKNDKTRIKNSKIPKFSNYNRGMIDDWGGHFEILKINTKVIDKK
jgi:hypothetical protein